MKTIQDYCLHLLMASKLEDKLFPPPLGLRNDSKTFYSLPQKPTREPKLEFSDKKHKIPRLEHLNQASNRGITLHHFANHELMAIELFAYFLLKFPHIDEAYKRETLKTIAEEQKHLKLYIKRMQELGVGFGDRPLNYIFWKYIPAMQTPASFAAILAISFEGANLDYSQIYRETFSYYSDTKSAKIMEVIYRDELKHVRRGVKIFHKDKPKHLSDWVHYHNLVSYPFTPRRAKAYFYFPSSREKVGLDKEFTNRLATYEDEFSNRKPEQIPPEIHLKLQNRLESNSEFEK
ncbi:MAG: DUF455 family protein [Spirochaetota bacterium]